MRRVLTGLACALALATAMSATTAGHSDSIDAVLARPVSPGTLALLLPYARDSRAPTRWMESLTHADSHVRATAARLLRVSTVRAALPALMRALYSEADLMTAREIAGAIVHLGGPNEDRAVFVAAKRLLENDLVTVVPEVRRADAIAEIPAFDQLKPSARQMQDFVSLLAHRDQETLDRVAQAVLGLPSKNAWWEQVLEVALRDHATLSSAPLEAALSSDSSAIRDSTWWYVAIRAADDMAVWKQLPVDPTPASTPPSTEGAFARELAARAYKMRPRPQPALESLARSGSEPATPSFVARGLRSSLYRLLTKSERTALKIEEPPNLPSLHAMPKATEVGPGKIDAVRTIGSLPAGYVAGVLETTGCRDVDSGDVAGAAVRFDANKLRELQWVATRLTPECDQAARLIAGADLLPEAAMTPGALEFIAIPMHRVFLECRSRIEPSSIIWPYRVGQNDIKVPHKVRHLVPVFPEAAQKERKQGIVILDATISPTGCVSEAIVVRSVATELDIAALRAVSGWGFEPTLLNGVAVPVVMTVTVQFTLQ